MIRINLLPHREQRRQARQRQFVSLSIGLAVLGILVVFVVHGIFVAQIENQQSRNQLLKTEIGKLDEQIKEIDKLREQTQALLARKQIVETLQSNRTEAVHLLDHADRICAVERPCLDADAQHRVLAVGHAARVGRDQVRSVADQQGPARERIHAQRAGEEGGAARRAQDCAAPGGPRSGASCSRRRDAPRQR